MKFVLQSLTKSGRSGIISEISRLPDLTLETPLLLLYTKSGCVPHLTHEVLQMVSQDCHPLHISLPTTLSMYSSVSEVKKGIGAFIGMKDYMVYCSVQDPGIVSPSGYNDKGSVSVWSRSGNHSITTDMYMDTIEAFQPDIYQALCDGDTCKDSSKKRMRKCAERTTHFLKECVHRHKTSEVLKDSSLLAVIEGGYSLHERLESAKAAVQHPVSGFVIDGLHTNGPDVEKISFPSIKDIVEETVKVLPEDKPRIIHGCWNPDTVLSLVESGIDVFDSSYPFIVSERGSALVFCNTLDYEHAKQHRSNTPVMKEESHERSSTHSELKISTVKNEENCKKANSDTAEAPQNVITGPQYSTEIRDSSDNNEATYEMSLKDERFRDDFQPLVASCECLCCRKHTRAYVHHLLTTNELLAPVLLSIHNLHHYLEFFKSIRVAAKEDTLGLLRNNIRLKI